MVRLRCLIRLADVPEWLEGMTENISRGGLLVKFAVLSKTEAPKIGEAALVDIPLRENAFCEQRYLRCDGEVVRVLWDGRSDSVMIAVRLDNMRVHPEAGGYE